MGHFLKLQTVVETLMLGGMLFQRIDPRTLKDLSPINLLVLGTTKQVLSNAELRPSPGGI